MIDIYAYAQLAAARTATALESELLRELEAATKVLVGVARYDLLVYVPPVLPLQVDDVRDPDRGFQSAVDSQIVSLLTTWEVEHLAVDPRDPGALEKMLVRLGGRGTVTQ